MGEHTALPPGAEGTKETPTIWSYYAKKGQHHDNDLIGDATNTADVLLIFVSNENCMNDKF